MVTQKLMVMMPLIKLKLRIQFQSQIYVVIVIHTFLLNNYYWRDNDASKQADGTNKEVIFKIWVPFTECITGIEYYTDN